MVASELQQDVLNYLRSAGSFRTALDIQDAVMPSSHDPTARRVRGVVRELNEAGHPIISTRRGFVVATSWEAVGEYRRDLIQRARKILERVAALDNIPAAGLSRPIA